MSERSALSQAVSAAQYLVRKAKELEASFARDFAGAKDQGQLNVQAVRELMEHWSERARQLKDNEDSTKTLTRAIEYARQTLLHVSEYEKDPPTADAARKYAEEILIELYKIHPDWNE